MRPIRVVIADDHPIVLDGLEYLLRRDSHFSAVGRAETAEETLRVVEREQPDILILDVRMPDANGLSVLRHLGSSLTRVVVLTAGIAPEEVSEAVRLGARAILLKQRTTSHLLDCLRHVHEGFLWFDPALPSRDDIRTGLAELSERERRIVMHVASGLRNKEIAAAEGISEATVKTHLRNVFRKTGATNRVDVIKLARTRE